MALDHPEFYVGVKRCREAFKATKENKFYKTEKCYNDCSAQLSCTVINEQ